MFHPYSARRAACAVLILALSLPAGACMAPGPQSPLELSRFDPFAADPAAVSAAIVLDRALHLRRGDIVMRVSLDSREPGLSFDETFVLALNGHSAGQLPGLAVAPNQHVQIAAIAKEDHARFQRVQQKARLAQEQRVSAGEGSLSITISGACRTGPIGHAATARAYLRTAATSRYVPLTDQIELGRVLDGAAQGSIARCGDGR
ncbi:hypothetical protein [Nitratireductor thuwali]|uniref:Lipoprotein n=1 Tax=Nitratireductor thuwali TaxID=2267699 RepID=A0ABY5MK94_9HYPH|nr:hypothetical protein NTH_01953 [Nitratireductor thuwali]